MRFAATAGQQGRGKERIVSYSSAIRAAGLFAVLGALSGLVCAFTPIVDALNISLGWTRLFSESATVPPLPGAIFGLLLAFLIYRHTSSVLRAASGIVRSGRAVLPAARSVRPSPSPALRWRCRAIAAFGSWR